MSVPSPTSGGPTRTGLENGDGSIRNSNGSGGSNNSFAKAPLPLAHVQDLQDRALEGLDVNQSITHLVTLAENSLRQAVTLLEYRKPDLAYLEYLRCYEILVNFVYKNPGYPDFKNSRGPIFTRYNYLIKRLQSREDQFKNVKDIIENDNKRNGTLPKLPASLVPGPKRTSISNGSAPVSKFSRPPSDPPKGDPQKYGRIQETEEADRSKPAVADKPEGLRSRPTSGYGTNGTISASDVLAERFQRLRMTPSIDTQIASGRPGSRDSNVSPTTGQTGFSSSPRSSLDFRNGMNRPNGPRTMNGAIGSTTTSPLGMDAHAFVGMPQPPTPAYSPARNMQIAGGIELPRTSARSIVGTGGRSNSLASSISSPTFSPGEGEPGYFARPPINGTNGATRRKSVYLPRETRVGAEKLYDYLKIHSVLLIDCRNRSEFDEGHIYTNNIICIEPAALRKDMSADQLGEALILSPESEQEMFGQRDQFDIVVYYDTATSSDQYLKNPRTEEEFHLRYLHDALFEYNAEKPLQRPPILLMGGIEAWTDLVGNQALKMSNTAELIRTSRPVRRSIAPGADQRIQYAKRRLRDYNPLDEDEERKWRERARKESVVVEPRPSFQEIQEDELEDDGEVATDSIDDFNRRFPDAASLGGTVQAVQDYGLPTQPRIPQKMPDYPSAPSPSAVSHMPTVPRRPAPAAPRMSYSGVNERSISLTKSAELPAYTPPHLQRLPRTGLVNFGVTCYMNSTIQALSATLPLTAFFLDDRYKTLVQRDNWKGSKGVLPDLYTNLIRSVWRGDVDAIRPSTLRAFCARLNREWGIDRQQDAKEFFDFLVDCLHEDLNQNWSRTPLKALTEEQEIKREKMPKLVVSKKEWDRYTHRELSYITSLFGGQHASRLKCTICHFTSTTYEAFYSISVEIPRSGKSSIEDCLKSYCQEEMLSGDEVWKCPRCKKQREATKQITITRAPQYLVVHFKRFAASKSESMKKVRTPIDFPLCDLDLEPYMLPQPQSVEHDVIRRDYGEEALKVDNSMVPPYLYDAYAVMRHIGTTMSSGHYTCLARDKARRSWRQFNDTQLTDFDPEKLPERDRLTNEMAYIVFFERKTGK